MDDYPTTNNPARVRIVIPTGPGRARSATGPSTGLPSGQANPLWAPSEKALKVWQENTKEEEN
ncbi:hypothetical protein HDU67_009888, partial [Dinochytrium kinnereticum]